MKKFSDRCPGCNRTISWIQKWSFAGIFGQRKSAPCPYCQKYIIYSKWPHRILNTGVFIILIRSLFVFCFPDTTIKAIKFIQDSASIILIAALSVIIGIATCRFEIANPENEKQSSEKDNRQ